MLRFCYNSGGKKIIISVFAIMYYRTLRVDTEINCQMKCRQVYSNVFELYTVTVIYQCIIEKYVK